uniref:Auxin-responsive protein n=3 Tax=Triticinae TaxID=1648030 RepID=A0A453SP78_AEGTS
QPREVADLPPLYIQPPPQFSAPAKPTEANHQPAAPSHTAPPQSRSTDQSAAMEERGRGGSNKIRDIVRLQQLLKRWKRMAVAPGGGGRGKNGGGGGAVPKGSFAVYVGEEMRRFVIPTEYLGHWAFEELLREAEEEFGFRHEGALRIPCDVEAFEGILRLVAAGKKDSAGADMCDRSCSSETEILCR